MGRSLKEINVQNTAIGAGNDVKESLLQLYAQWPKKHLQHRSDSSFAKTTRHLSEMFSRCLKDSFFANLKRHLKGRSVSKTLLRKFKKTLLRCLKAFLQIQLMPEHTTIYTTSTDIWKLSRTYFQDIFYICSHFLANLAPFNWPWYLDIRLFHLLVPVSWILKVR